MKEFPNESKNKWTRIFKKKWFFPAVYIVLAAFLLSGVVWYQNVQSKVFEGVDDSGKSGLKDEFQSGQYDEDAKSVIQQEETIKMPVQEEAQTEIVTKFYDYSAEEDEQEKGLTFYNNRYYQSTGVDIAASDGETFDVSASLSGTVEEVKQDPLHGNVVTLDHGDEIKTYYASLEDVKVKEGDKIKQGEQIATAGKNLFSEDSGTHVHFEIAKEEVELNPEDFFNQSLAAIKDIDVESEQEPTISNENKEEMDKEIEQEEQNKEEDNDGEMENQPETDEDTEAAKDVSFSLPV